MRWVETLVVGAGQAGLAVSRCLAEHGAEHVVVERGRVAERWRTARWESLRLITPSWMSRLPLLVLYWERTRTATCGLSNWPWRSAGIRRCFTAPVH